MLWNLHSLKLTWPLKMVFSNRNLLFQGGPIFRGYASWGYTLENEHFLNTIMEVDSVHPGQYHPESPTNNTWQYLGLILSMVTTRCGNDGPRKVMVTVGATEQPTWVSPQWDTFCCTPSESFNNLGSMGNSRVQVGENQVCVCVYIYSMDILLMAEILHQLIGSLSHYL